MKTKGRKELNIARKLLNGESEQIRFFYRQIQNTIRSLTNDYIRLNPNRKPWDENTYELINQPTRKFENL